MRILLDTHVAIWAVNDDKKLTKKMRDIILNPENDLYYSAVSTIEIDWKIRSKKNNLDFTVEEFIDMCQKSRFIQMPIKSEHIAASSHLIWDGDFEEHKDPFDRMILAQAMVEGMNLMTHDNRIPYFRQDCVIQV